MAFPRCRFLSSVGNGCKIKKRKLNVEPPRKFKITTKFQRLFLQFTLNVKMMLRLTRKVSLFARNHKIHPNKPPILYSNLIGIPEPCIKPKWSSEFLKRFSHRKMEIQNFSSPNKHSRGFKIYDANSSAGEDSGFHSPQKHRRAFRIPDPPKNTGETSEFLIPPITQAKIQNIRSSKDTGKNYEFLIPQ